MSSTFFFFSISARVLHETCTLTTTRKTAPLKSLPRPIVAANSRPLSRNGARKSLALAAEMEVATVAVAPAPAVSALSATYSTTKLAATITIAIAALLPAAAAFPAATLEIPTRRLFILQTPPTLFLLLLLLHLRILRRNDETPEEIRLQDAGALLPPRPPWRAASSIPQQLQ